MPAACASTASRRRSAAARSSSAAASRSNGFVPGELSLTATGERMRFNYPEGFRSEIDADLTLRGSVASPLLDRHGHGARRRLRTPVRDHAQPVRLRRQHACRSARPPTASAVPLRFDIQIDAPAGSLRDREQRRAVSRRAPTSGCRAPTIVRILSGRAEIDRGDVVFEGNRYLVTRGHDRFRQSRRRSSRTSTSKPKRGPASPTRPTASPSRLLGTTPQSDPDDHLRSAARDEPTSSPCSSARTPTCDNCRAPQPTARRPPRRAKQDLLARARRRGCSPSPFSAPVGKVAEAGARQRRDAS